jgi:hypothetical protein
VGLVTSSRSHRSSGRVQGGLARGGRGRSKGPVVVVVAVEVGASSSRAAGRVTRRNARERTHTRTALTAGSQTRANYILIGNPTRIGTPRLLFFRIVYQAGYLAYTKRG